MHKQIAVALAAAATLTATTGAQAHTAAGSDEDRTHLTAPKTATPRPDAVSVQLLTISDWHGQLEPLGSGAARVGGAPALKAYFDEARAANPNTLTFTAGDSVGATPPVSSFFEDEPAIEAMNMMGVDADALGNHNFDAGVGRLQRHVDLADFSFLAANLPGLDEQVEGVAKRRFFDLDGVRVAVIGITNEEAPTLVAPGSFGSARITDGVAAAHKAARQARDAGADAVVVLTHKGIRGVRADDGTAFGELVDFTEALDSELVDVVIGDHTDFAYTGVHGGILAVENRSKGATFSKVQLTVDPDEGVLSKGSTTQAPLVSGVTPDAGIQAYIDELKRRLAPVLGTVIGDSTVEVLRTDSCGNSNGRICESLVGDVVTDALRETYGTQIAITNSGGLRAALTCPAAGSSAFCPASSPVPFPITRGSVLGVLPFGNVSATGTLTGAEVRRFLEHGLSFLPGVSGAFPQVSGLCAKYDIAAPANGRLKDVRLQAPDGSCTGAPIPPGDPTTYTVTTNDFMASGGDGYPKVIDRFTTRGIMDADVAAYVRQQGTISPRLEGRLACVDTNGDSDPPNCPVSR